MFQKKKKKALISILRTRLMTTGPNSGLFFKEWGLRAFFGPCGTHAYVVYSRLNRFLQGRYPSTFVTYILELLCASSGEVDLAVGGGSTDAVRTGRRGREGPPARSLRERRGWEGAPARSQREWRGREGAPASYLRPADNTPEILRSSTHCFLVAVFTCDEAWDLCPPDVLRL